MRKLLLLFTLTLCTGALSAQLDTFNLANYKLPDIKRKQLDFQLDFDGFNSLQNYEGDKTQRKDLTGFLNLGYNSYRNSNKYQGDQFYTIHFSPNFQERKENDNLLSESLQLRTSLYLQSENRFYYNGKQFIETDLVLYGGNTNSKNNDYGQKIESKYSYVDLSVPLLLGTGRIEQIQDSRLAVYILQDLYDLGKLTRVPTHDEIIEFSELISQLKNERFFDSRLQKIKELKEVDTFLQSTGLLKESDIDYFTSVNDNWDYAATFIRESGNRFSVGVEPSVNYYYYESESNYLGSNSEWNDKRNEYGLNATVRFTHEKPVNLYLQSSFEVNVDGGLIKGSYKDETGDPFIQDDEYELNTSVIQSNISYRLGYFPNTRTNLNLRLALSFLNYFGDEEINGVEQEINHLQVRPTIGFNVNYYISPQFRFELIYGLAYNHLESDSEYLMNTSYYLAYKQYSQNLGFRFIYKIF